MMAEPLEHAKIARNVAHEAFHQQLAQLRADLAARGIGGRIADRAGEALSDAAEVASDNKGVIAGTAAAIVLWFLRGPIISFVARLWTDSDETEEPEEDERNDDD